MNKQTPPWEIRTMVGFHSGRVTGYTVERIHNPYTRDARAETLDRGRVYPTEEQARAAIAKASGEVV